MADSGKQRQARHRRAHPEREKARQTAKRSRTPAGAGRVAARRCAMAGSGGCAGAVEAHHSGGYAPGSALRVVYLCKRHHEQRDAQKDRAKRGGGG